MDRVSESLTVPGATMAFAFPSPDHLPCPECGASVPLDGEEQPHICDDERRLDFRLFELRHEIDAFDDQLAAWLESPAGRFEQWLAERRR